MGSTDSHPDTPASRPLPVLRALIDAADHDLLQVLARRNALVAEIAHFKRAHQVPIRDFEREREILEDRCGRALSVGLSPELAESLFRLILWGSRDRQAALRVEVPPDVEPKSIALIGGRGGMGRCLAGLFGDLGHGVMVADVDTSLSPEEAAALADVVVISVPIDKTDSVIRRLGPLVRRDALLMDVTSIKQGPMEAMLEASEASVVGTHPLFGPSVHSLQGQRVVMCRGRGGSWFDWLDKTLRARGLVTKEATPDEHDRVMAVVQVLVHFSTEVMGRTLAKLGVGIEETLAFTSPIYLMELLMSARHFAQSPELYGAIQRSNPRTPETTGAFVAAARELSEMLASEDQEAFACMFEEVRHYFGSFTHQALEQSSFLIDRLVERG